MKNCIPSAVYVMLADNGQVKVGRSRNVKQRARDLSWTGQNTVSVAYATEVRDDGSFVEAIAHRLLAEKRMKGEWFSVTVDEAVAAIKSAIECVERSRAEGHRRPRHLKAARAGEFTTISVRLPKWLAAHYRAEAKRRGMSISAVLVEVLEREMSLWETGEKLQ